MKKIIVIAICIYVCFCQTLFSSTIKRNLIFDTDMGYDDAIALLYILNQAQINLLAISIAADGNAHCKPAYQNTLSLLRMKNKTGIPIACGRHNPYPGGHAFPPAFRHQMDIFNDKLFLTAHDPVSKISAVSLIASVLKKSDHPVDILAIGPLTNIADVINEYPALKAKIRMIYLMGGAVFVPGNISAVDPTFKNNIAEWNIYFDPRAAKLVFHSGIPITMVSLDTTNQIPIDREFSQQAANNQSRSKVSQLIHKMIVKNKAWIDHNEWYFWDPLAAVIAMDESIATFKTLALTVTLGQNHQSGATVVDNKNGAPVRVCMSVKKEKFKKKLLNGLE